MKQTVVLSSEDVELVFKMLFRDYRLDYTDKQFRLFANWPKLEKEDYDRLMEVVNAYLQRQEERGGYETANTSPIY